MQEFLNPKAMITPGAAGALMMFLVNGLYFHFPELSVRFTALAISFLIGAGVVFYSQQQNPVFMKGVYWVLNSLTVFVVGFGTSNLAADVAKAKQAFLPSIVATAHAQPEPKSSKTVASKGELKVELERTRIENEKLKSELERLSRENAAAKAPAKEKAFFQRW